MIAIYDNDNKTISHFIYKIYPYFLVARCPVVLVSSSKNSSLALELNNVYGILGKYTLHSVDQFGNNIYQRRFTRAVSWFIFAHKTSSNWMVSRFGMHKPIT